MSALLISEAPPETSTMDDPNAEARGIIVALAASAILWAIGAAVWSALT